MMQKTAIVLGAGGFIGSHLVTKLKSEGFYVKGVDLKVPDFGETDADEFQLGDLRDPQVCKKALTFESSHGNGVDEVYQLAADMGGAGYIFTGEHDFNVMHNSATINLNVAETARYFKEFNDEQLGIKRIFYSSSACIYPEHNQLDPDNPNCEESSAYPANPDSEYGWEKLFSERMYKSLQRNCDITVRIARFHNIFGVNGTWEGGKEKAPAAMCRKVAETPEGGVMEVWGKGDQTRSFLYIDECVKGILKLTRSDCEEIVNIGSEEMISINNLAQMAIDISGKNVTIKNVDGPTGVRGRNSDNRLIQQELNWEPNYPLIEGMKKTYKWISNQVDSRKES